MNYTVVETIVDIAGKYRVRVLIDENTAQFFKFDHAPSQEEIDIFVTNYLKNQNKE